MTLKISAVPPQYVQEAWPQAAKWLEPALERAPGRFGGGDLFLLLSRGQQLLWVVMDDERDNKVVAAFTSRIYSVPLAKIAAVEWVGGDKLELWIDDALDIIEKWARDNNCTRLEGHGRRGWGKVVATHGWKWLAESYEKVLD